MDTFRQRSVWRIDRCIYNLLHSAGRGTTNYKFIGSIVTDFLIENEFKVGSLIAPRYTCIRFRPQLGVITRITPKTVVFIDLVTSERVRKRLETLRRSSVRVCDLETELAGFAKNPTRMGVFDLIRHNYKWIYSRLKARNFLSL